jgi:glycolate oxidase FAD binding subunit
MSAAPLPLTKTESPATAAELVAVVRQCIALRTPIYPLGGGTALDYGLPPKVPGIGLSLANLSRVVDYPARDMTVTVEAGIRVADLQKLLAAERQRLPIDAPQAEQATLGGVIATNTSGPRRYANGTLRDYVIGISAVDGHGTAFKAGGRVVKNVAGYDFCRLLVGSLGTLAVITQVTLKVKPLPEQSAFVVVPFDDLNHAELLIAALSQSRTAPAAIDLLLGPAWNGDPALGDHFSGERGFIAVGLEGTKPEVNWMIATLRAEMSNAAAKTSPREVPIQETEALWHRLTDFPATQDAALALKLCIPPSRVTAMLELLLAADPHCSIQAHAGNGILIARFAEFSSTAISKILIGSLQPAAQRIHGSVTVLRAANPVELTHQAAWGVLGDSAMLMEAVKRQFDPHGLLNPGRM